MAAAMNAMLTKYLKDFSIPESTALVETDILSSLAGSPLDDLGFFSEPEPAIDLEAERETARQEGHAAAVAECEERFAGDIAAIAEEHSHELQAMEDRHQNEIMSVIHARFFDMTLAISQSVADQALQVLLPVVEADLARRSVAALGEAVHNAFIEEKAAEVLVRGPAHLFELLKPRLEADGVPCRHIEAETTDIFVEINETVLTTRLSSWAQSLAEVME